MTASVAQPLDFVMCRLLQNALSPSSPHLSTVRKARDSGASETSNIQDNRVKSSQQPFDVGGQNTHVAKRTPRRYARDVSYYDDDGELESVDGRLGKRQPIDRIDEPSEWRDRLRIMNSRIQRHPVQRFALPVLFDGRMQSTLNKRQPMDRIDEPSRWRQRFVPKLKEWYVIRRRTRRRHGGREWYVIRRRTRTRHGDN